MSEVNEKLITAVNALPEFYQPVNGRAWNLLSNARRFGSFRHGSFLNRSGDLHNFATADTEKTAFLIF